jgi:hypothetical protein
MMGGPTPLAPPPTRNREGETSPARENPSHPPPLSSPELCKHYFKGRDMNHSPLLPHLDTTEKQGRKGRNRGETGRNEEKWGRNGEKWAGV